MFIKCFLLLLKVKKCIENESGCERSRFLLPLEVDYLNREARFNLFPTTSTFTNEFLFSLTSDDNDLFTKHFTLFKPPRAMRKLDELKNKGNIKKQGSVSVS